MEAVIDNDLSAALLAREVHADFLMLLTDVDAVQAGWGTPDARPIRMATADELRHGHFAAGSMGPKVEAACRFVTETQRDAAIGSLERASEILDCTSGTRIVATRSLVPAEKPQSLQSRR